MVLGWVLVGAGVFAVRNICLDGNGCALVTQDQYDEIRGATAAAGFQAGRESVACTGEKG